MLSRYVNAVPQSDLVRFQFDQRVMAKTTLGQILWLQGFPDQAMRTAQEAVDDAQAIDHATSLCNSLAHTACRVALLNGDLTAAEHFVGMLIGHSERHALAFWQIWGRCFKGVLLIKRDEVATGLHHLRVALAELRVTGLGLPHTAAFLGDLAEGLGRAGEIAQGLAAIDEAIESSQRNGELWCMADSLRIKGDLLLQENSANACEGAENHFRQCLDWARKQRVLSWELRGAMSLARLRKLQGQPGDARELLAAVYGRFTEGFATADLKSAKSLLDSLL